MLAGATVCRAYQVAVELGEDDVALPQLAEDPGLGLEEGALAKAEEDSDDDARRRLDEDARGGDDEHDDEVPLPGRGAGGGREGGVQRSSEEGVKQVHRRLH